MLRAVAATAVAALLAAAAHAGESQARFVVSVGVPAWATAVAAGPEPALVISDADVARGYAEVTAHYRLGSNSPRGCLLQLAPRLGLAGRVEVRGLGGEIVLRDQPVELRGCAARGMQDVALQLRVVLPGEARAGRYPLPVLVTATPL